MPDPDPEEAHRVRLAIAANLAGLSAATEHVSRSVAECPPRFASPARS